MQLDLLDRLLRLASPEDGAELLVRLDDDLTKAAAKLAQAENVTDQKALGDCLHVLVGITGSIGADRICALTREIGQEVRALQQPSQARLAEIQRGIAFLLAEVKRRTARGGASG